MGRYSIKELETLSGIKAHTIRIWEKRHRLIEPKRTSTNIRYYSDDDLKKIINVSLLNSRGLKISRIAVMNDEQLNSEIIQLTSEFNEANLFIDQFTISMIDMEEAQFDKLLSHVIMKLGFERTILEVLYPFLKKIGILWQTGNISPAQEHFISNLVKHKIIVAIDALPIAPSDAQKIVLFLPENELHEIGLLFYHYVCRNLGFRTYYLGQHLPYSDLKSVCETHKPRFVVTALTASQRPQKTKEYFELLVRDFPEVDILISGHISENGLGSGSNLTHFSGATDLKSILSSE